MKQRQVTQSEVLEVVVGQADPALEARVHEAIAGDPGLAKLYVQWSGSVLAIQRETEPLKEMNARVRQRVLRRVAEIELTPPAFESATARIEQIGDSELEELQALRRARRLRVAASMVLRTAALLAIIGLVSVAFNQRYFGRFTVERIEGEVVWFQLGHLKGEPARARQKISFPAAVKLMAGARADFRLPGRGFIAARGPANLELINHRRVRQASGTSLYRVERAGSAKRFQVDIPQGRVIDLGTEFKVTINDKQTAVVEVQRGRVRVEPSAGRAVEAAAGERAIISANAAVVENQPRAKAPAAERAQPPQTGLIQAGFKPRAEVLAAGSALASFIQPQVIQLAPDSHPGAREAPAAFGQQARFGQVTVRRNGRPQTVAVASARQPDGHLRIGLDANLNGSLGDDRTYEEGRDFVADQPFAVTLGGVERAALLRRPIQIGEKQDSSIKPLDDRLEYRNMVCLAGDVEIDNGAAAAKPVKARFTLLDSNSDGAYDDPGGSLAVWGAGGAEAQAVAPAHLPTLFMGYKWNLVQNSAERVGLAGWKLDALKLKKLRTGDRLPSLELETIRGERLALAPPRQGYLLIYVWSTWFCACQRDVPFDFKDLYPKFHGRGLSMVGISTDYRRQDLEDYIRQNGIAWPQVFNGPDLTSGPAAELGIERSPLTVLVDASGEVISVGQSADELWSFLDAQLPKAAAGNKASASNLLKGQAGR